MAGRGSSGGWQQYWGLVGAPGAPRARRPKARRALAVAPFLPRVVPDDDEVEGLADRRRPRIEDRRAARAHGAGGVDPDESAAPDELGSRDPPVDDVVRGAAGRRERNLQGGAAVGDDPHVAGGGGPHGGREEAREHPTV